LERRWQNWHILKKSNFLIISIYLIVFKFLVDTRNFINLVNLKQIHSYFYIIIEIKKNRQTLRSSSYFPFPYCISYTFRGDRIWIRSSRVDNNEKKSRRYPGNVSRRDSLDCSKQHNNIQRDVVRTTFPVTCYTTTTATRGVRSISGPDNLLHNPERFMWSGEQCKYCYLLPCGITDAMGKAHVQVVRFLHFGTSHGTRSILICHVLCKLNK